MSTLTLVLSSAVIGALVSSVVNGVVNLIIKKREWRLQEITLAARLAEMKHQQVVAVQEWAMKTEGRARNAELWDPLQTVIEYLQGMDEFRKACRWEKKASTSSKKGGA